MSDKISIIVPVFNSACYIEKCVNSLTTQSYKNIEVILVDDGSTDGSGAIMENLSKSDHRLIVIHKKNGGVSSARNVGILKASGDYLMFVDSDDWVEKDFCV